MFCLQAFSWTVLCVCRPPVSPCCVSFASLMLYHFLCLWATYSTMLMFFAGHLLSPSPTPHVFTRWSTSRLNSGGTSTSTSPCGSARSSFNYRQPYLGWRSQERLTRPRTPAERLAAGLLPSQQQQQQHQLASPQGIITPKQTQQELQQLLQQEAELEQLQREDEEQVG